MHRSVTFEPQAFKDFCYWQSHNRWISFRIAFLIHQAILGAETPDSFKAFAATQELDGTWNCKLTGKHRLIFRLTGEEIRVLSCRHRRK